MGFSWVILKTQLLLISVCFRAWTPDAGSKTWSSKNQSFSSSFDQLKGPSTLATLVNHMWPRIVAGIFIPVGNHYFQALASTLQFVAQVCDRLWLVPATDRAFAYITYMSPPHVALMCSGPPQCAATCGWTKWPVCSGPNWRRRMLHFAGENRQLKFLRTPYPNYHFKNQKCFLS